MAMTNEEGARRVGSVGALGLTSEVRAAAATRHAARQGPRCRASVLASLLVAAAACSSRDDAAPRADGPAAGQGQATPALDEGEASAAAAKRPATAEADAPEVDAPQGDPSKACRDALQAMAKKRCAAFLQREVDVCRGLDDNAVCDAIRERTAPCRQIFDELRAAEPSVRDADVVAFAVRGCGETPSVEALAAGPAPGWTPDRLCDLAFAEFLRAELSAAAEVRLPMDRLLAAMKRSHLECPKKYEVAGAFLGPEELGRRRECWTKPDEAGRHFSDECLDPLQLPPDATEGTRALAMQLMTETICSDDPTPCVEHGICGARILAADHPIPKRRSLVECAAVADADCARSKGCLERGDCSLDASSGRCAPATKDHCKASRACKEEKKCRLVDHGAAAASLGRARRSCAPR